MKNLAKAMLGATIGLAYGVIIFPVFLLILHNRIEPREGRQDD